MSDDEARLIGPAEARDIERVFRRDVRIRDLSHTAAVLGEQREAVLALHQPMKVETISFGLDWFMACTSCREPDGVSVDYPCPTARALGATE